MSARPPIRLFVDTAEREAAESWLATGMFVGLTTNPKILEKGGRLLADIPEIWTWARAATPSPRSPAWSTSSPRTGPGR